MSIKVRYLSKDEIEREAELLLAQYAETIGGRVELPIPVDEITKNHLALDLGFADLHDVLGVPRNRNTPDILGAIWVDKEAILIDEMLDPNDYPSMSGRYRFSVAHEIGHWCLHRGYVSKDPRQAALFDTPSEPTVVCRSGLTRERIEWQADKYASCLLMPRQKVREMWQECFNRKRPLLLSELKPNVHVMMRAHNLMCAQGKTEVSAVNDALFEEVSKPIARRFAVSPSAMRIRLEELGLLLREAPKQAALTDSF